MDVLKKVVRILLVGQKNLVNYIIQIVLLIEIINAKIN